MGYPIQGSCQCGQLTYTLKQPPKMVMACHCQECQKLATGPFSVTAVVAAGDIEFSGEVKTWQRIAESGNKNAAAFCPECGNRAYHFNPEDMSTLKLKLKANEGENRELFEPQAHIWLSEKQAWYQVPEGMKCFDKQP